MLAHGIEPAKRFSPFVRWPTLALILSACGGGGGGGGSGCPVTTFTRAGADEALALFSSDERVNSTPPTVTFGLENGVRSASIPENTPRFISKETASVADIERSQALDLRIEGVNFVNAQKAILDISANAANGRRTFSMEYIIGGEDAKMIELVSFSSDGKSITFQAAILPDYERPMDANGDNVYSATITARYSNIVQTYTYNLRINDENDGPTTVASVASPSGQGNIPAHTREGDEIRITVEDGNREVFVFNIGDLNWFSQNLLTGPDADKFQFKTIGFGSSRKAIIEFKDAPSTDAPTDVGVDNIYNFELDGAAEDIYGDINFVVEVV